MLLLLPKPKKKPKPKKRAYKMNTRPQLKNVGLGLSLYGKGLILLCRKMNKQNKTPTLLIWLLKNMKTTLMVSLKVFNFPDFSEQTNYSFFLMDYNCHRYPRMHSIVK